MKKLISKKSLGILMALFMLTGILAACAQDTAPAAPPADDATVTDDAPVVDDTYEEEEEEEEAPALIEPEIAGDIEMGDEDADVFLEATFPGSIVEFEGTALLFADVLYDLPNIQVTWTHIPPGDYWDRVNTLFAGNMAPDILFMSEPLYSYASMGVLLPLDDFVDASPTFDRDDWIPAAMEHFTVDGTLYGIPKDVNVWFFYYNIDLFEEAGIPSPGELYEAGNWNWDTFVETAIAMTIVEGDRTVQFGSGFPSLGNWPFSAWLFSAGADIYNEDMTESRLNSPEAQSVFQLFVDLFNAGATPNPTAPVDALAGISFETGALAMVSGGSWAIAGFREFDFAWDVVPIPGNGTQDEYMNYVHNAGYSITLSTNYPNEAWEVMERITSVPVQIGIFDLQGSLPPTFTAIEQITMPEVPSRMHVLKRGLEVGRPYPFSVSFAEEAAVQRNYFEQMVLGLLSVEEATDLMVEEINAILRR